MHTRILLAIGLLAVSTAQAASVEAPDVILTGTLQVRLEHDPGIAAARFYVDDTLVYQAHNLTVPFLVFDAPVGDGRHEYRVEAMLRGETGALEAQLFEGEFSAQNLAPLIRAAVSHIADSSLAAQAAAEQALAVATVAASEARNASLAAGSIEVPSDLTRQSDLSNLAKASDTNALAVALETMQERDAANSAEVMVLRGHIEGLERSFTVLVVLLALSLALLIFAVARLRRAAGYDDGDRLLLRAMALHVGLSDQSPAYRQAQASIDPHAARSQQRQAKRRQRIAASNDESEDSTPEAPAPDVADGGDGAFGSRPRRRGRPA